MFEVCRHVAEPTVLEMLAVSRNPVRHMLCGHNGPTRAAASL
jgi:hypothetical protein